ncbi:Mth938-like domain-containing protein [Marinilabilia rubra]|uniref:Uncharacterized protein n=1 Tax=Marinilabilia rubra TaxID=2162893 RepID=A0A2U2B850_9BACT|nr:MTH938/NDUFAF3 family protein [Marinilabilia rubra]PWD99240.1 hypothetical protein DDZ16_11635 [Marinilabilia rubra]
MKPRIYNTSFGSITIEGNSYNHDVVITPSGEILKRKKKLSKSVYGTSHIISEAEARFIFKGHPSELIIGTGQTGYVELSKEAETFFEQNSCKVQLYPTPIAIEKWNMTEDKHLLGLFHITC